MLISDLRRFVYWLCIPFHFNKFYVKTHKCNYFHCWPEYQEVRAGEMKSTYLQKDLSKTISRSVLPFCTSRGKHRASKRVSRLARIAPRKGLSERWWCGAMHSGERKLPLSITHKNTVMETLKRGPLSRQLTKNSTKVERIGSQCLTLL